ncbi:ester cyclase [Ulvibacterium sp.]|uniref:ester cyclase n=1 Tax=Ulvibacterium sp. TaxID=2665914 RepID=UPI003BACB8C4
MKIAVLLLLVFLFCVFSCSELGQKNAPNIGLSPKDSTIRANLGVLVDSCWNNQDTTLLTEISVENFVRHLNGIQIAVSKREMQAHMNVFFTAFPDLKITLDTLTINNNKAFLEWTSSGTNTGIYGEVAPTGKKVKMKGFSHLHFTDDGVLSREDVYYNELDLLQQLGYTLNPPILE